MTDHILRKAQNELKNEIEKFEAKELTDLERVAKMRKDMCLRPLDVKASDIVWAIQKLEQFLKEQK